MTKSANYSANVRVHCIRKRRRQIVLLTLFSYEHGVGQQTRRRLLAVRARETSSLRLKTPAGQRSSEAGYRRKLVVVFFFARRVFAFALFLCFLVFLPAVSLTLSFSLFQHLLGRTAGTRNGLFALWIEGVVAVINTIEPFRKMAMFIKLFFLVLWIKTQKMSVQNNIEVI